MFIRRDSTACFYFRLLKNNGRAPSSGYSRKDDTLSCTSYSTKHKGKKPSLYIHMATTKAVPRLPLSLQKQQVFQTSFSVWCHLTYYHYCFSILYMTDLGCAEDSLVSKSRTWWKILFWSLEEICRPFCNLVDIVERADRGFQFVARTPAHSWAFWGRNEVLSLPLNGPPNCCGSYVRTCSQLKICDGCVPSKLIIV